MATLNYNYHTFEGLTLFYSQRSVLFQCHYWDGPLWFPLSQTEIIEDGDDSHVLRLSDWLAKKRGILEFTHYSTEEIDRINNT